MRFSILRGGSAAWLVGLARGLVEAAVLGALIALAAWLAGPDVPVRLIPYVPFMLVGLRFLEGLADQIDPAQRRAPTDGQ